MLRARRRAGRCHSMTDIPRAQDQLFDSRRSAREKYAALVVGRPGWGALLRHELVTLLAQRVPGALGLALRKTLYPCAPRRLRPQRRVRPERRAAASAQDPHRRQRGHRRQLPARRQGRQPTRASRSAAGSSSAGTRSCRARTATSCSTTAPTSGSTARSSRRAACAIGRGTLLAAYCYLIGGDHDFSDPSRRGARAGAACRPGIDVGEGAWLGAGAKILDGVTIGDRAVVGAGAVVRDAVPDGAIAVGVPARIVGTARRGASAS